MAISLKGDQEISSVPTTKSKALRINLNSDVYGTFAEIGAGQETARNFFRSGAASGTIAKAMSAYDKDFSDAIYGVESDNRYVTESRLKRILGHEIHLMEDRLSRQKHPNKLFFSYANTVTTIDFARKIKIFKHTPVSHACFDGIWLTGYIIKGAKLENKVAHFVLFDGHEFV